MRTDGFFWPLYMILCGLMLLLKLLFRLEFNVFNAAFAILLMESGVYLLLRTFRGTGKHHRVARGVNLLFFGVVKAEPADDQIAIALADAVLELPNDMPSETKIDVICARLRIKLPQGWSARVQGEAVFSAISTPEGAISGIGEKVFLLGDGQQCRVHVNAVLASVEIID